MALVLAIVRLVAAASQEAVRPRWRECEMHRDRAAPRLISAKGGLGSMKEETAKQPERAKRLTRRRRKELARRIWSDKPGLDVVHRDAAGIDIGSREHYVAVGPDRDAEPVRVFGCFTTDLRRMAEWLQQCGI